MARKTVKTVKTKSTTAVPSDPPVTPGEPVQTGSDPVAAEPGFVNWRDVKSMEGTTEAPAKAGKAKAMPKEFAPKVVIEGRRAVLRQDGVEVAFRNTDDEDAYGKAYDEAKAHLWTALEGQRT